MHKFVLPKAVAGSYLWFALLPLLALVLLPQKAAAKPLPQAFDVTVQCFGVADERWIGNTKKHEDVLVRINRTNAQEVQRIGLTGTSDIEAIAFGPNDTLYAADGGYLGTLDYTGTGEFIRMPKPLGTANGSAGKIKLDNVDGLFFDIGTKTRISTLYGVQRREGAPTDLLFAINPATGEYIQGAFGGQDYLEIGGIKDFAGKKLNDVDDIAVDPTTGVFYAAMNSGGDSGVLVSIDLNTGALTRWGEFRHTDGPFAGEIVDDIEGLSFFNDGQLYGSTGENGPDANDKNQLFRMTLPLAPVDIISTTLVGKFPANFNDYVPVDYEGLACLTAKAFIKLRTFTNAVGQPPENADAAPGPQIPAGAPVVWTYVLTNTGVLTLTDISLTDDKLGVIGPNGVGDCPPANAVLGPGDSMTCQVTGTAQLGQYSNAALVTALTQDGVITPRKSVADGNVSHYYGFGVAAIELKKATNGDDADSPTGPRIPVGADVVWTYAVRNTGAVALDQITVTDDKEGPIQCPPITLQPGERMICVQKGKAQPGLYTNLATAMGIPTSGPPNPVTASDRSHYFGVVQDSCIFGQLWYDDDGNRRQNNGEDGIAGVTLQLVDGNNTAFGSQTTNATGNYSFTHLAAGVYTVTVATVPADAKPTVHPTHKAQVTLGEYDCGPHSDFGYQLSAASVGGRLWYDDNGNGQQDPGVNGAPGEAGIVTKTLNLFDSKGILLGHTNTDIKGDYAFSGLAAGTYTIQVDVSQLPPTAKQTYDLDHTLDHQTTVTLRRRENGRGADFGYQLPATISGLLWLDNNCNGQRDQTEQGLANVTIALLDSNNTPQMSARTNDHGVYSFTNLAPGAYTVQVVTPTLPADAQQAYDPDPTLDHKTTMELSRDATKSNVDFGYHQAVSSIQGRLWIDANANGLPDANEGLAGVTVELLSNSYAAIAKVPTDANGDYQFTNLLTGVYIVRVVVATLPADIIPIGDPEQMVIVAPCGQVININFKYVRLINFSVSGKVWNETTGSGIGNVQLSLLKPDNTLVATVTTLTDGSYTFANLLPGAYIVKVNVASLPPGLSPIRDPEPPADHMASVTLPPKRDGFDFVYGTVECSISGLIWLDENANGTQDGQDRGIPNVKVDLFTAANAFITSTRADPNGHYGFASLTAGEYILKIDPATVPSGYLPLHDADGGADQIASITLPPPNCQGAGDFSYQPVPKQLELELSINGEPADTPTGPVLVVAAPIIWTYHVQNAGAVILRNVQIRDDNGTPNDASDDRQVASNLELAPNQSQEFTLSGSATLGQHAYVATAIGEPADGSAQVQATNLGHYLGVDSPITVTTTFNGIEIAPPSGLCVQTPGQATWSYTVRNIGDQPLVAVQITDTQLGPIWCPQTRLEPKSEMTCTAGANTIEGNYQSTITASGQPLQQDGQPAVERVNSKPVIATYLGWRTSVALEKLVNGHPADDPNDKWVVGSGPVAFTYVVTNTGATALTQLQLDDTDKALNIQCPAVATLAPGATMHCTATGTPVDGDYSSTATFVAQPLVDPGLMCGAPVTVTDPANYKGVFSPDQLDLSLTQEKNEQDIGAFHKVTATLLYTATQKPVAGQRLYFQVSGLHAFTQLITTNAQGQAVLIYPGTQNVMPNNASQASDKVVAWMDLNDNQALDATGDQGEPTDKIDVVWQRIDIGICRDEGGTVADPVRRITVKVTHFGEDPMRNCDPPQSPVQGVQVVMQVTGGTTVSPQIVPLEDGQPLLFTYLSNAPRLVAAAQVAAPRPSAEVHASQANTVTQALADTDLINVWVDVLRNSALDRTEPFDLAEEITAVQLATFTVQPEGAKIVIRWTTGVELDTAGFNLYRAQASTGDYTQINDQFIGAVGEGHGASYEWVDTPPAPGQFYYRLEAINNQNGRATYAPQAVWFGLPAALPNRVYLPTVLR